MKILMSCVLILGLMGGCAHLTDEQKARVEVIVKENEDLAKQMAALLAKAKAGLVSPSEVVIAIDTIRTQMEKNVTEIKAIQDSGATWSAILGGVIGTFGRTAIHAVAAAVPGGGPIGAAVQALLTLLLGGSSTKKKEA